MTVKYIMITNRTGCRFKPNTSIINLSVNGLNISTEGQRLAEWIENNDPIICYLKDKVKVIVA